VELVGQILASVQKLALDAAAGGTVDVPSLSPWLLVVAPVATALIAGVVGIVRLKIKTDANLKLVEMVLERTGDGEVSTTVDSLAKLQQFHPRHGWRLDRSGDSGDKKAPATPEQRARSR
jgi:hypothetical protein